MKFFGSDKNFIPADMAAQLARVKNNSAAALPKQIRPNLLLEEIISERLIPDSCRQLYATGDFTMQLPGEQRRQIIDFAHAVSADMHSGILSNKMIFEIMWCFRRAIVNHLGEPRMFEFLAKTLWFDVAMRDKPERERALPGVVHVLMFAAYLPPLDSLQFDKLTK